MDDLNSYCSHALASGSPDALRSWQELEAYIMKTGFLPLFYCGVPGFSAEEHTIQADWFSGSPYDPWEWRRDIAAGGKVAYGKFFAGKAGFVSKEWFPRFANYRRDGYDFDARWDDELASLRSKKIMDLFAEENADRELFSYQIKEMAGLGKGNFEGEMAKLQMLTYLCYRDFRQRTRKDGKAYGWSIGILCTPEHLWGYEYVSSAYSQKPEDCKAAILKKVKEEYPKATNRELEKLLGIRSGGDAPEKKTLPYPANLVKAMRIEGLSYDAMSPGQRLGLTVALGQLQTKHQRIFWLKYGEGKKNDEIGQLLHKAAGTIGSGHTKAMSRLKLGDLSSWYLEGYNQNVAPFLRVRGYLFEHPFEKELGVTKDDYCLAIGLHLKEFDSLLARGVVTIEDLEGRIRQDPFWYSGVKGIGKVGAEAIVTKMKRAGFLQDMKE